MNGYDEVAFRGIANTFNVEKLEYYPVGTLPVPDEEEPDKRSHLWLRLEGEGDLRCHTQEGNMSVLDVLTFLREVIELKAVAEGGPLHDH